MKSLCRWSLKELAIEVGYRIDMRIDQLVSVEKKTVEKILPIHLAQLLTYLKLSGLSLGLIINWSVSFSRRTIAAAMLMIMTLRPWNG